MQRAHFTDDLWKIIFGSSEHFLDNPDTFQIIRTLFRLSGHYVDHLGTFQIIWIWTLWIFSGWTKLLLSISDIQQAIQQKVAGIAKTLRSALLMRWQGFSDSANKLLPPIFGPNGNLGAKSAVSCFWANNQYIRIVFQNNIIIEGALGRPMTYHNQSHPSHPNPPIAWKTTSHF